ncbi:DUF1178 family protein [Microvirga sp. TS319]|uniref:DUF1178 family protein n=1 Tax=Microvirga sp. TS319 TaxID=3241165 RepID=UPI00351A2904
MIKYALACEQAHEFESWFPSSEAFETQRERGFVTCPFCDSPKVDKQIMAPSVARTDKAPDAKPEAQPMAVLSDREREIRAALRALREHVIRNSEDVGKDFVEEARKMHYGEAEERSIYGEADLEEARALLEEGIDVLPIPHVPDDRN